MPTMHRPPRWSRRRRPAVRSIGALPGALHDAAGAGLGGSLYVFGGGDSAGQLDGITRVDPSGTTSNAGRLPAPSSDSTAAVVGTTAYVVGGYTGSQWLDTIVAFTPGSGAHIVAHLPTPLRYAAVGSVGGRLVIAGGSTPSTRATTAVYVYDPAHGAITRLGDLPIAVTHASAAGLGRAVLVVGGQDSARGARWIPSSRSIRSPRSIRVAGHLLAPRSDASLTADGNRLRLIGGHNASGTLSGISAITATDERARTIDVYSHDGAEPTGTRGPHRPLVGLRAEQRIEHGRRDRSEDDEDRRALRGRRVAATRHARHGTYGRSTSTTITGTA